MAEKLVPKDRAEWLTLRKADVTASQIAALVNQHPYCTAYQLWAEKTGKVAVDNDIDSPAMRRGRLLESVAVKLTVEALPLCRVEYNNANQYWRDPTTRIGATPDVLATDERGQGVVQLKSVEPSVYARNWENGEPPLHVALQALTEAKLTGAPWAAVGALRVGHGVDFDLVSIPLHEGAWSALLDAVGAFWRSVESDTPPEPNYSKDADLIAALNPISSAYTVDLSQDNELVAAVADHARVKAELKTLDDKCGELEGLIRHKVGNAEVVLAGDYRLTLRTEQVKAHVRNIAAYTRRPIRIKKLREAAA